jgi:SAM-dependent methyltransferase
MRSGGVGRTPHFGRRFAVLSGMLHAIFGRARNDDLYHRPEIVAEYAQSSELFPSEKVVLERLRQLIPEPTVLDIGVGGGRTTPAFSEQASRYVGIDYSAAMIKACESQFAAAVAPMEFCVGDVRQLSFEDDSFDFVLFSFNGIDTLDHPDRLKALHEVYRVCAPGAIFSFSSHNLWSLEHVYDSFPTEQMGLYRKLTGVLNRVVLRTVNPPLREALGKRHVVVKDGVHGYRLSNYYADPNEALRQLAEVGFESVTIYDQRGDVVSQPVPESCTDDWLAYICFRPQTAR